jgi:hypothetical protein
MSGSTLATFEKDFTFTAQKRGFLPPRLGRGTTGYLDIESESGLDDVSTNREQAPKVLPPVPFLTGGTDPNITSTPVQIWEGTVIEIDIEAKTMQVELRAKLGAFEDHTAEIDLEWVSDQDQDLLIPGAVFYLTVYKRTIPSIENSQELRFRRRPSWNDDGLKYVKKAAEEIMNKGRHLPTAND